MTIKSYNFKNQILNSDEISRLISYSSDEFAGALSTSDCLINRSSNTLTISSGHLVGAGRGIELSSSETASLQEGKVVVLRATYSDNLKIDEDTNLNIDFYNVGNIVSVSEPYYEMVQVLNPQGNPAEQHFYILDTTGVDHYVRCDNLVPPETEVVEGHTYFELIETYYDITLDNGEVYKTGRTHYYKSNGQIVGFEIPIAALYNNTYYELLCRRSKASYKDYLTAQAYDGLKKFIEENFVWHEAGSTQVGNYAKGQIGNLLVSDTEIKNISETSALYLDAANTDPEKLHLSNLTLGTEEVPIYIQGGVLKEGTAITSNNPLAVERGGTGANNATTAKMNLRLFHGDSDPESIAATNLQYYLYKADGTLDTKQAPLGNPRLGDIYFKIIND